MGRIITHAQQRSVTVFNVPRQKINNVSAILGNINKSTDGFPPKGIDIIDDENTIQSLDCFSDGIDGGIQNIPSRGVQHKPLKTIFCGGESDEFKSIFRGAARFKKILSRNS